MAAGVEIRYYCTPWRRAADLLEVREKLFRLGQYEHEDGRKAAIDLILAWEERGEIPLALNSTVLLVQAALSDDVNVNSHLAIRMTYSAAVLRFVTGICDAMQDPRNGKQSMLQIAVALQLPVELVEARHAISHKELPSLSQLRLAAELGMKWLWSWYWSKLDDLVAGTCDESAENDLPSMRATMQAALKRYLGERRTEVKKKAKAPSAGKSACQAMLRECGGRATCRKMLLSLLVDERMVIPSDRRLGDSMEGAFLLWDNLLSQLSYHQPGFIQAMIKHMQARLAGPASVALETDPTREALCEWITHILTSDPWSVFAKNSLVKLQQDVMEECFVCPTRWSLVLARNILSCADNKFVEDWQPILEAASATSDDDLSGTRDIKPKEEEDDRVKSVNRPLAPGWALWRGYWGRRPIGGSVSL